MKIRIVPLTVQTWVDLESLFGAKGACGGCWCMWWRLTHAQFERQKGQANHLALKALVEDGVSPGLLAYDGHQPIGWCSLGPRREFVRLETSRILKPIDDLPVWSIVCFFVAKDYRNRGVSLELLAAAVDWMKKRGGRVLEGYPVEPTKDRVAPLFAYTGLATAFAQAGFVESARRSPSRPIMRFTLE